MDCASFLDFLGAIATVVGCRDGERTGRSSRGCRRRELDGRSRKQNLESRPEFEIFLPLLNSHRESGAVSDWLLIRCLCTSPSPNSPTLRRCGSPGKIMNPGLVIGANFALVKTAEASQSSLSTDPRKHQADTDTRVIAAISHNGAPSCSLLPVLQEQGEHFLLRFSGR